MPNKKFIFYKNVNDTSIDSDNKSNKRRRSRGDRSGKGTKKAKPILFQDHELIPNIIIPEAEPTPTKPELINIIDEDPLDSKLSSLRKDFCTPLK